MFNARNLRSLAAWFCAWATLIALGTVLHWGTWIGPHDGTDTVLNYGLLKLAANVSAVFAAPGWILCTLVIGRLAADSLEITLVAHGLAWLLWLCCLALVLRLRARVLVARSPSAATDSPPPPSPEALSPSGIARRRALVDGSLVLAGLGSAATLVRGTLVTPWDCQLVRYTVPIRDLPAGLDGLRMVYISDTHLGPRVGPEYIRSVLARAMALKPDVFLLGGDYIHNGPRQIDPAAALFVPLVATGKPVVGVLGNHDWYADGPASAKALRGVGVSMVDNSRVFLDADTRGLTIPQGRSGGPIPARGLCLAGLSDYWQDKPILPSVALAGVPRDMPRLLLSHNPDAAEDPQLTGLDISAGGGGSARLDAGATPPASITPPHRVDLMLSGHTHGGQVKFPFLPPLIVPSQFRFKYARGLIRGPAFPVLVSAGVGVSLIPVRIGVPPELLEVTLVRAQA